jgi:hypothetical protein
MSNFRKWVRFVSNSLARPNLFDSTEVKRGVAVQENLDVISDENLEGLENLLDHSLQGVHLLFDNERVARILRTPTDEEEFFQYENMERVQNLITELLQKETLFEKLCFTHSLPENDYELLVRAYFHILERAAQASDLQLH